MLHTKYFIVMCSNFKM